MNKNYISVFSTLSSLHCFLFSTGISLCNLLLIIIIVFSWLVIIFLILSDFLMLNRFNELLESLRSRTIIAITEICSTFTIVILVCWPLISIEVWTWAFISTNIFYFRISFRFNKLSVINSEVSWIKFFYTSAACPTSSKWSLSWSASSFFSTIHQFLEQCSLIKFGITISSDLITSNYHISSWNQSSSLVNKATIFYYSCSLLSFFTLSWTCLPSHLFFML